MRVARLRFSTGRFSSALIGSLVLAALLPVFLLPLAVRDVVFERGFLRLGPVQRSSVLTFLACIALSLATWAIAARRASVRWLVAAVGVFGGALSIVNGSFASLVCAVFTFSCVLAVGRICNAELLRSLPDGIRNQPIVHCAVGFAVVQNVLFLLGWVGWLTKPFGAVVLLVGLAALRSNYRELGERSAGFLDARAGRYGAMSVALLTLPVWIWLGAPDVQFDAIYAKGWLPQLWASTGSIEVLTGHPVLGIMGSHLTLAVPGHLFGAHDTGRFLQFGCGVLVALTPLWLAGRNRRQVVQACLAAIVIASSGHVLWQMATAYDDLLVLVEVVAVLLVAFASRNRIAPSAGFAVGLLAASALSSKLYLAPLAALVVLFCLARAGWRTIGTLAIGGLIGSGGPILMRWFETSNPVFPQYNALFKSPYFAEVDTNWNLPFDPRSSLIDALLLPFRAVLEPAKLVEVAPPGSFGLLVLGFGGLVIGVALAKDRRPFLVLAAWTVVWWFQLRYLRYLLPVLAGSLVLLCLQDAVRLPRAIDAVVGHPARRRVGWAASAVVGVVVGACLLSAIAGFWNVPERVPIRAAIGRENDRSYLERVFPQTAALVAVNRLASSGDRVVGDLHGRSFLRLDIDLSPSWEAASEVDLAASSQELALVDRYRQRNFRWVAVTSASRLAGTPSVPTELIRYPDNLVWAGQGYEVFDLNRRPSRQTLQCRITGLTSTTSRKCGSLQVDALPNGFQLTTPCRAATVFLEATPVALGGAVDLVTRSGQKLVSFLRLSPTGRMSIAQTIDLPGSTISLTGVDLADSITVSLSGPCVES